MKNIKVKIKSYNELKDKPWFVDDMRCYCGKTTEIIDVIRHKICPDKICPDAFILKGCDDWQWREEGFNYIEEKSKEEKSMKKVIQIKEIIDERGSVKNIRTYFTCGKYELLRNVSAHDDGERYFENVSFTIRVKDMFDDEKLPDIFYLDGIDNGTPAFKVQTVYRGLLDVSELDEFIRVHKEAAEVAETLTKTFLKKEA